MITSGPSALPLPVRSGTDLQPAGQTQPAPAAVSGAEGEQKGVTRVETVEAVEAPRQTADPRALPQNDTNARAPLVEPSRASAESLTRQADTPDAKTPAGPPPTFDWSVLEKARALANSVPSNEPEPAPLPETQSAEEPEAAPTTSNDPETPKPARTSETAVPTEPEAPTAEAQAAELQTPTGTRPAVEGPTPPGVEPR